MTAADVHEILDALDVEGVRVWIEGGWGVDALLGERTRPYDDLDAAVDALAPDRAATALAALGFARNESQSNWWPARLVLRDSQGRQVDFHPLHFADDRTAVQRMADWAGQPDSLREPEFFTGTGTIAGRRVTCTSAAGQIRTHDYPNPDDVD